MSAATTSGVSAGDAVTLPRLFAEWAARYADEPALSSKVDGVFTPITLPRARAARAGPRPGVRRGPRRAQGRARGPRLQQPPRVDGVQSRDPPGGGGGRAARLGHAAGHPRRHLEARRAGGGRPREPGAAAEGARRAAGAARGGAHRRPRGRPRRRRRGRRLVRAAYASPTCWPAAASLLEERPGEVERLREALDPGDLATVIYTSGTTGDAQGSRAHARQLPAEHPRDPQAPAHGPRSPSSRSSSPGTPTSARCR